VSGEDQAYQRRAVIFSTGASSDDPSQPGVHVSQIMTDTRPGELVHQPGHEFAIKSGPNKGMVRMPNVNALEEMINLMEAARAYDANITVMNATKTIANAALRIIA
jgi:flagellar basal-body rod protein FlgC